MVTRAILSNGTTITVEEPRVVYPELWVLDKLRSGIVPTRDNFPMASALGLINLSWPFSRISKSSEEWKHGFVIQHPELKGVTVTAEVDPCTFGGQTGNTMRAAGGQQKVTACLSRALGLPLRLSSTNESTRETSEYVLTRYSPKKLNIPATFHSGEPEGFRGMKWGSKISELEGMVEQRDLMGADDHRAGGQLDPALDPFLDSLGDLRRFRRSAEDLVFEGVPFLFFDYFFEGGKFFGVRGKFRRNEHGARLRAILHRKFGKPSEKEGGKRERYIWGDGKITIIGLELGEGSDEGTLNMLSVELFAAEEPLSPLGFGRRTP